MDNHIECFHSRDQHLRIFIGTKEIICIRKEFNSHGLVWDTNMAAISLFWDTNMAAVTSCENSHFLISPSRICALEIVKFALQYTLKC